MFPDASMICLLMRLFVMFVGHKNSASTLTSVEERFLAAQADHLAGARWEEKASACSARNDSFGGYGFMSRTIWHD